MSIKTPVHAENLEIRTLDGYLVAKFEAGMPDDTIAEIVRSINLLPQLVALLKECEEFIFTSAADEYDTVTKMVDFENRIQSALSQAKIP